MPQPVHALVITRHGARSHSQLLRTFDALGRQSHPLAAVTLVVCGDAEAARESTLIASLAEGIIQTRASDSFAQAVSLGLRRVAKDAAVWILDHDCVPAPDALSSLAAALERAPRAALAAPKLLNDASPPEIVSFGITMTDLGRTFERAAGEQDQGQHDGDDETLGADVRGLLLRAGLRDSLALDAGLGVADLGLDLGIRARLAGNRTVLVPDATVVVSNDGPAALPQRETMRSFVTRRAQLHRRLAYAPAPVVLLHWLSLLPLALWRSILHLIGKRPASVLPEWAAALRVTFGVSAVVAARRRIRRTTDGNWSAVEPFRIGRDDLRRRLDDGHGSEGGRSDDLRFFSGGGAWAVLASLVVSIAVFTSLLAWPVLGGGALLPLRTTLTALWSDALWGVRGLGLGVIGPADPFAAVIAIIGSLSPTAPSRALVVLWLLALPLAVLGGWFASTRFSDRAWLRIAGGVLWAVSPSFLTALIDGRPAAVIAHLLLPWFAFAALAAHRSWGAAGAASLLLIAVVACAPSLSVPLAVLWALAILYTLVQRRIRILARVIWLPIPPLVVFAPLIWWQWQQGNLWALLADPGAVWAGPQATPDAAGRLLLATGFPSPDRAGWSGFLPEYAIWAPLLLAPLALLALTGAMAPRWRAGIASLLTVGAGLGGAFLSVGVFVSFAGNAPVAIWPGTALSLMWLGLVGAALVTLDSAIPLVSLRGIFAGVAVLGAVLCAVPALTAVPRDASLLQNGPSSTLPAYVAADARGDLARGTLIITHLDAEELTVRVVWGASDTLGAQTTMLSTATEPIGGDVAELAGLVLTAAGVDIAEELAERGIRYILIAETEDESDQAREVRLTAITALTQRAELVRVGETDKGMLWRTDAEPQAQEMSDAQRETSQRWLLLTVIVLLGTALLSLPTKASRRAAHSRPRVVGGRTERR